MMAPGTIRYIARELLDPKTNTKAPLATEQSDIWSAGMTGLEVCLCIDATKNPDADCY